MGRSTDARNDRCRSFHSRWGYVHVEAEGTQMTANSESTGRHRLPYNTLGETSVEPVIAVNNLNIYYDKFLAVRDVTMEIAPRSITALIGHRGAENRRFAVTESHARGHPKSPCRGVVQLNGEDIYRPDVDPVTVRRRIGMVFNVQTRSPPCRFTKTCLLG